MTDQEAAELLKQQSITITNAVAVLQSCGALSANPMHVGLACLAVALAHREMVDPKARPFFDAAAADLREQLSSG